MCALDKNLLQGIGRVLNDRWFDGKSRFLTARVARQTRNGFYYNNEHILEEQEMKAVILHGKESVELGEFPTPSPKENEVRVAVAYCGICGSDFHKVAGKQNTHPIHYPVPLGHEISGRIAEVGAGVTSFKVGDRVTVDPNWSCGKCRFCQMGKPSFCENARGVVKGMADYVVSPVENVYRLPDSLDLRTAALAEPVACCLHGMDLLGVQQGENVALVGFGAIGKIMLQLIRNAGAGEIAVLETDAAKREIAMNMGASYFVSPADKEALNALTEKVHFARVIECVGVRPAQETALAVADKGATVVLFGVADAADRLSVSVYDAFLKELTIKTSFVNPYTTARAVSLLASGAFNAEQIIAKELSMEEAVEEFRSPRYSRLGKVLVRVNGDL